MSRPGAGYGSWFLGYLACWRPGTFKALGIHMEYLIPENTSQPGKVAAAFNSMYNEKNTSDAFADSVKE
jgi:hypothetical protein